MSDLETELRAAIATGQLHGMTLFPSPKGWQGNVRWNGSLGWTVEIRADPAEALVAALRSRERYDHAAQQAVETAPAVAEEPVLSGGLFD